MKISLRKKGYSREGNIRNRLFRRSILTLLAAGMSIAAYGQQESNTPHKLPDAELSEHEQDLFRRLNDYDVKPEKVSYDDELGEYVYQVSKKYYDQFSYKWTDAEGKEHTSVLTERATEPQQILALLKEVYTNPLIPGFRRDRYEQEEVQSLFKVRNNVDGMEGSDEYTSSTFYQRDYNAAPKRKDYVTVPYEPCNFGPFRVAEGEEIKEVVKPFNGATALLVEMNDDFYSGTDGKPLFPSYKYGEIPYDQGTRALDYVEAVTIMPKQSYIDETSSDNPGFMFNMEASISKCFIVTKGNNRPYKAFTHRYMVDMPDPDDPEKKVHATLAEDGSAYMIYDPSKGTTSDIQADKKPFSIDAGPLFYNMYEEFSPSNTGPITEAYTRMNEGKTFEVDHNCSSAIAQEHDVILGKKNDVNEKFNINLMFFLPDKRFAGITNYSKDDLELKKQLEDKKSAGTLTDDEQEKLDKLAYGPYAPYTFYAEKHKPYFFFNKIYAKIDGKIKVSSGETHKTADGKERVLTDVALVPLHWESLYKTIIKQNDVESFHVHRIRNVEVIKDPVTWDQIIIRNLEDGSNIDLTYIGSDGDNSELLRKIGPNVAVYILEKNAAERAGEAVRYIIYGKRAGTEFSAVESNLVYGFLPNLENGLTLRLAKAYSKYENGANNYVNDLALTHTGYVTAADSETGKAYTILDEPSNPVYSDLLTGEMKNVGGTNPADISDVKFKDLTLVLTRTDELLTGNTEILMKCNLADAVKPGNEQWLRQYTWKIEGIPVYTYALIVDVPFFDYVTGEPTGSWLKMAYNWDEYNNNKGNSTFRPLQDNGDVLGSFKDVFSQSLIGLNGADYPGRYRYQLKVIPNSEAVTVDAKGILQSNRPAVDVPKREYRIGYEGFTRESIENDTDYKNLLDPNRPGVAFTVSNNPYVTQYSFHCESHGAKLAHVERFPGGIYQPYLNSVDNVEMQLEPTADGYSGELSLILNREVYEDDNLVMVLEFSNTGENLYTNGNTYGFPIKTMPKIPQVSSASLTSYYYSFNDQAQYEGANNWYYNKLSHSTTDYDNNNIFRFAGYGIWVNGTNNEGESEYQVGIHDVNMPEDYYLADFEYNLVHGKEKPSDDNKMKIHSPTRLYSEIINPNYLIPSYNPLGTQPQIMTLDASDVPGTGMYVVSDYAGERQTLDGRQVTTEIDSVNADSSEAAEYFNLQGMKVSEKNLTPGIYIRIKGNRTDKIVIR